MTDEELITFIGKSVVNNWEYIAGIYFALLSGGVALSWMISNLIHKKEIKVLQLEIAHQKERFSQFESIMEQRIASIRSEAEMLQNRLSFISPAVPAAIPLDDPLANLDRSVSLEIDCSVAAQDHDIDYLDFPASMDKAAPLSQGSVSDPIPVDNPVSIPLPQKGSTPLSEPPPVKKSFNYLKNKSSSGNKMLSLIEKVDSVNKIIREIKLPN
ncbi:hypothetical protein [Microbulbifer sp. JMSA003]|uniref:hypothetical protein n=1 Tax=Microbulbifer sp. JMSA003 TaxID=3243369 RepID=UPI00403A578F